MLGDVIEKSRSADAESKERAVIVNSEVQHTIGRALVAFITTLSVLMTVYSHAEEESTPPDFANSFDFQTLGGMVSRLQPHGNNLMGDMIDRKSGGITFEHTDVAIPGNSGLEVALRRKLVQGWKYPSAYQQAFGDWVLDVPIGYFGYGVRAGDPDPQFNGGCLTQAPLGDDITVFSQNTGASVDFRQDSYKIGWTLHVPGKGLSGFQRKTAGLSDPQADWVSGGQGTDYLNRCAEIAVAPDGTKYKFGRSTLRVAAPMEVPALYPASGGPGFEDLYYYDYLSLERRYGVYLITEVEDIHGNWVRYEYNSNDELERISSNDGREITVQYGTASNPSYNSRYVSEVAAHGRIWGYDYDTGRLKKVELPDDRFWEFGVDGHSMSAMGNEVYKLWNCAPDEFTFAMRHPDGVVGTFRLQETRHIKNSVNPYETNGEDILFQAQEIGEPTINDQVRCRAGQFEEADAPPLGLPFYRAMSLVEKTLTGTNTPTATWTYEYRGYSDGGPDDDWENILETWTKITEPEGTERVYTHHANGFKHGLLKSINVSSPSGAAEAFTYEYDSGQPLDLNCGFSSGEYGDELGVCHTFKKRPQTRAVQVRDGVTYITDRDYEKNGTEFIDYGRPNTITWSSSLQAEQRVLELDYWHNTSSNLIGLTERITRNGKEFVYYSYNSAGQPDYVNRMGDTLAWETYDYHTDGTLKSVTDPIGHTAAFTEYHRGQAQRIVRRDGTIFERVVDDNGWVTSETNGRGFTTSYDYTDVGWLKLIDRPVPWVDTIIAYQNLGGNDFHRIITRGTKETVEWFDPMLRLRLVRERPLSGGGITSYRKTDYDALGRAIFASLPSASADPSDGTVTTYDGLGRVTKTRENYSPFAETTTEYLSANQVRVTDPLGYQTTTTSSGYGSPTDGNAVLIEQPEDVSTAIEFDVYGNIRTATQSGTSDSGTHTSTQTWSYDNELRLCRFHTTETGSKLFEYDDANRVYRYSEGNSGTTGCTAVPTNNRVTNTYDEMGRLKIADYSDDTPDVYIGYDENGNVKSNTRGATDWAYEYNSADQLEKETLSLDGRVYGLSYQYHPMGHLIERTLPSGRVVEYVPDGLGMVNQVVSDGVSYASGIDYHVNGVISDMTYGNGQQFNQSINARQLPERLTAQLGGNTAMDLDYRYDSRGQIIDIYDYTDRGRDRVISYDDLGRLETANGIWGVGSYKYDALGNLRTKQLGNRTVNVNYNAKNRANQSIDTAGGNRSIGYDTRGNVISLGSIGFVYDMANQPVELTGGVTGTYSYDGNFKRVRVEVEDKLIYNVFDASGSLVHIDEVTGGPQLRVCLTSCGDVVIPKPTDYIRANGYVIARLQNDVPTYLHPDLLGSPVAATNAAGSIEWQEHYTPYGEKWLSDLDNTDQMSFTGHIADSSTGLTYMQARYYDPRIGRFLSNDPVTIVDSNLNPAMFNRYAYVENDPFNGIDPNGLVKLTIAAAGKVSVGEGINIGFSLSFDTEGFTLSASGKAGARLGVAAGGSLTFEVAESTGFAHSDVVGELSVDGEANVGPVKGKLKGAGRLSLRDGASTKGGFEPSVNAGGTELSKGKILFGGTVGNTSGADAGVALEVGVSLSGAEAAGAVASAMSYVAEKIGSVERGISESVDDRVAHRRSQH